jgi:hypothetical protein
MTKYLAIDPSGNFTEGKGKTGFAFLFLEGAEGNTIKFGTIDAKKYEHRVDYWFDIALLIAIEKPHTLIVEDYRLYNTSTTGAAVQSFSLMETPRLLGVIEQTAYFNDIKQVVWQMANVTKPYSDDKLLELGILTKKKNRYYYNDVALNDHERSALRHLLRYLDKEGIKL